MKEHAEYALRRARVQDLHQKSMMARYVHMARRHGLTHREIGEVLGHTEGWVRQYLKDTAGKTEIGEFAEAGFRGLHDEHDQFFKEAAEADFTQKLHLCAEYGLSTSAVAALLSIPMERAADLMEGPRAEAAA